jgi:hypothetical protein
MHFSKEEKVLWLEDWRQSGKSAWTYAKENGLNPQTFIKWSKGETEAKTCFVQVQAQVSPTVSDIPEILIEKGDVKIHIPLVARSVELKAIMEGLGAVL